MEQPVDHRSFYNRIAGAYDAISEGSEHAARQSGQQLLALQPGERVLEIGFGTGNTAIDLAHEVGPTGKIIGIDNSEGMRDVAAKKLAAQGLSERVGLHLADARKLPFEAEQFDAAFTSFTLELFEPEDIAAVLAEVKRTLKPGGRLGVVSMAVVKAGEQESVLEKTYQWFHQHFPHIVDCHPIDVGAVLTTAGFEISGRNDLEIWTMPVTAAVAVPG